MTEEEAKNTRCCGPQGCGKVLDYEVHRNSVGDHIGQSFQRFCIGSSCMAWRWNEDALTVVVPASELGTQHDEIMTPGYYARHHTGKKHEMRPREGFCGLAGKP